MADQIKVRFFTQDADTALQAPETPLFVPTSLKKNGLSEVVNHLLATDLPVQFDFLIDGSLLRGSLADYLHKKALSKELLLQIEYTRAVLPPLFLASFNNEDWCSAVAATPAAAVVGSYDGVVRTYSPSGSVTALYVGHLAAVRAVAWILDTRMVSGANDRQVRLWRTKNDAAGEASEPVSGHTVAILDGHEAPVVSVAVGGDRILSAGLDGQICVWATSAKQMATIAAADMAGASSAAKKRKRVQYDSGVLHKLPLQTLTGHTQAVEAVVFDSAHGDRSVAYSVSQDHTIKTWDLVMGRCVDTRTTAFPLLSVCRLEKVNLIASGSSARHINLHDPRVETQADRAVKKLVGHTNFVVDLAAAPANDYLFASASHDNTVKVWDVRGDRPLHLIARASGEGEKVLAVDWAAWGIVSGGDDKKVQIDQL